MTGQGGTAVGDGVDPAAWTDHYAALVEAKNELHRALAVWKAMSDQAWRDHVVPAEARVRQATTALGALEQRYTGLTPAAIVALVSAKSGIRVPAIVGSSRSRPVTIPRHVAIWLCRNRLDLTLEAVGTVFNRDHTSIRHACQRVDDLMATADAADPVVALLTAVDAELSTEVPT